MLINLPICKLYNLGENQIEIHSDYFFPREIFPENKGSNQYAVEILV